MSLEEALNKNTAAVERHNELLEKMLAGGGKAAPAADADDKPASKAKPAASKAKPAAKPAAKKAEKKETTVDDVAAAFGKYLKTGDTEEREAAKANVKAIVDYFGVAKATAIPAESFDEALGYLAQYEAGETPEFDGGPEDEGEEEEALV